MYPVKQYYKWISMMGYHLNCLSHQLQMKILKQMKGLGHIPLKVPNVKFDYDVTDIEVINVENLT